MTGWATKMIGFRGLILQHRETLHKQRKGLIYHLYLSSHMQLIIALQKGSHCKDLLLFLFFFSRSSALNCISSQNFFSVLYGMGKGSNPCQVFIASCNFSGRIHSSSWWSLLSDGEFKMFQDFSSFCLV